uniref:Uncharacterized protein n=1 Tax=Rhizophora mucronata TaxID=61149 RepID=A0A2P2PCY0_RHIMU
MFLLLYQLSAPSFAPEVSMHKSSHTCMAQEKELPHKIACLVIVLDFGCVNTFHHPCLKTHVPCPSLS